MNPHPGGPYAGGPPPIQGGGLPMMHQPPHAFGPPPPFHPPPPNWLPPGWTEHKAPDGLPYFYNASTGTSSWVRPGFNPPGPPGPPMGPPPPGTMMAPPPHMMQGQLPAPPGVSHYQQPPQILPPGVPAATKSDPADGTKGKKSKKNKKEKAVKKTQILETSWFIVVTSHDNTFFYNKETKSSLWVPTPELETILAKMGQIETERLEKEAKEEQDRMNALKRPLENESGVNEADKKPKNETGADAGTEMTEDDVAWQLAMMEDQMGDAQEMHSAQEDGDDDDEEDDEAVRERLRMLQGPSSSSSSSMLPPPPSTSSGFAPEAFASIENIQEKEMAFLNMMRDRGVTQFDTWEKALAKIEQDPRMYLIPAKKDRQELFESFCVIRAQEIRDAKEKAAAQEQKEAESRKADERGRKDRGSSSSTSASVQASSSSSKPEDVFRRLMENYTTKTSTWLDFMTKYRTDPQFLGLKPGSLRESIFRKYLSDLKKGLVQSKAGGSSSTSSPSSSRHHDDKKHSSHSSSSSLSKKYKATEKEIHEFMSLLKETRKDILYEHKNSSSVEWRKIKRSIDRDRRYDAVGSSTEREMIFREYADRVIQGRD